MALFELFFFLFLFWVVFGHFRVGRQLSGAEVAGRVVLDTALVALTSDVNCSSSFREERRGLYAARRPGMRESFCKS